MRKLFAVLLLALTASGNEISWRSLQSGSRNGAAPLHDRGIRGEGQLIAVLDTGVDYTSCYFAEPDNSPPPFNTGSPLTGFDWENVDLNRRKVVAYDYLYSCDQFPGAPGCETAGGPGSTDNQGHGTHAAGAALGDRGGYGTHDYADAIAPAAKLIVQDAGFIGGDNCSQRPGIGCPVAMTPILEQAWKQGARIHSNSWGDRQGVPAPLPSPTANYPQSARDVDAFVWSHPDMLVVFNTGNYFGQGAPPRSTLSAPGSAKNTLQIGGTRSPTRDDDVIAAFSLFGPSRDGRIKPDLVGPATVIAADRDFDGDPATCDRSRQGGTSWSSPTVAGAAALVRQYYTDGFYPSGSANAANGMIPSAALLKATLIASARRVPFRREGTNDLDTLPTPSYEQGWGFPVLDDALYFPGDARKLRVVDVPLALGLSEGTSTKVKIDVRAGTPLRAVLVWTDPPGVARAGNDGTPQLVNDLDLRVANGGATLYGNGAPDRLNNVEVVNVDAPASGIWEITVAAQQLRQGPRQSYALVITGDISAAPATTKRRAVR